MIKLFLLVGVLLVFGFIVLYNNKVLKSLETSKLLTHSVLYKLIGKRVKKWNTKLTRASTVNKDSFLTRISGFFKDIIINLDMERDNVTPVGLVVFIACVSLSVTVLFVFWTGELSLFLPMFLAIAYFIIVVFRFMSLMKFEKREAEIMDAVDLISMDVKGGVKNAIMRYKNSFHPNIRFYFNEFLDNVQTKGFSFKQAMLILNDRLGSTFNSFAQKAIWYEEKADNEMDDIFSAVIEINRYKRTLRYENNIKFNNLRAQFIVATGIIALYGVFAVLSDPFLLDFFTNVFFGKVLLIIDVIIVTSVLAYISSIKAKFL